MAFSRQSAATSFVLAGYLASGASGGVLHNEGVDGDITGDRFNPAAFVLTAGSNTVSATSVSGDREYVRLTVPVGTTLSQVVVNSYAGGVNVSFIGVQAGDTMTVDPTAPNAALLLGYAHFGPASVGNNILSEIATGAGSMGFTPPLNAGNYTFWIQETSATTASAYTLDFVVVPGPGGCVVLGMAGVMGIRRRR